MKNSICVKGFLALGPVNDATYMETDIYWYLLRKQIQKGFNLRVCICFLSNLFWPENTIFIMKKRLWNSRV